MNVHALTEDNTGDMQGSFYNKLECVFYKIVKHHLKILLADFSAKVGKEYIYKPRIRNKILY
jgi:hypothetical protein